MVSLEFRNATYYDLLPEARAGNPGLSLSVKEDGQAQCNGWVGAQLGPALESVDSDGGV